MTTTNLPPHTSWVLRLWRTVVQAMRSRATARMRLRRGRAIFLALAELDDRTLRDLGIDRSELGSIACGADDGDRLWRSTHWSA